MSRFARGTCCAVVVVLGLVLAAQMSAEEQADSPFFKSKQGSPYEDAVARIEAILDQPLKAPFEFQEEPLIGVIRFLQDEYDIPIFLDNAALDEVGISSEIEITVNLRQITLSSALKHMLRQPGLEDLTFVIDSELLMITTRDRENSKLQVEVYRVDDLIGGEIWGVPSLDSDLDFDSLIDLIIATIGHDSWRENGNGAGDIRPLVPGILIVSQTQKIHQRIEELLVKLRSTRREIVADAQSHGNPVLRATRGFAIRVNWGEDAEDEREFFDRSVRQSVDWEIEEDGDAGEVWIRVMPDLLLVRHHPSVVRQVGRVIQDMGISKPVSTGGAGHSAGGGGF